MARGATLTAVLLVALVLAATFAAVLRIAFRNVPRPPPGTALSYEARREARNLSYAKRQYVDGRITLDEFEDALPAILETEHEPQLISTAYARRRPLPVPVKPAAPTYLQHDPVVLVDGLGRIVARYPPPSPKPTTPGYEGH